MAVNVAYHYLGIFDNSESLIDYARRGGELQIEICSSILVFTVGLHASPNLRAAAYLRGIF